MIGAEQLLHLTFALIASVSAVVCLEADNVMHSVLNFTVFLTSISMLLFLVNAGYVAVFVLAEFVGTAVILAVLTVMVSYREISKRGMIDVRTTVASALLVTVGSIVVVLLILSEVPNPEVAIPPDVDLSALSSSIFAEFGVSTTLIGFFLAIVLLGALLLVAEPDKLFERRTMQAVIFGQATWLATSLIMFSIGLYGVISKRNMLKLLFASEIITAAAMLGGISVAVLNGYSVLAQTIGIFATVIGTLELIVGIALIYAASRELRTIDLTELSTLRG